MDVPLGWEGGSELTEENILAGLTYLWSRILVRDGIKPGDNIFEMGASSLDVMTAVNHLRDAVIPDLSPLLFFENPTISEQARRLADYSGEQLF